MTRQGKPESPRRGRIVTLLLLVGGILGGKAVGISDIAFWFFVIVFVVLLGYFVYLSFRERSQEPSPQDSSLIVLKNTVKPKVNGVYVPEGRTAVMVIGGFGAELKLIFGIRTYDDSSVNKKR
jgi:hypothetical protein